MKMIALLFMLGTLALQAADTAVQIDVRSILNTRVVTTLTKGRVLPFRDGVDAGSIAPQHFGDRYSSHARENSHRG